MRNQQRGPVMFVFLIAIATIFALAVSFVLTPVMHGCAHKYMPVNSPSRPGGAGVQVRERMIVRTSDHQWILVPQSSYDRPEDTTWASFDGDGAQVAWYDGRKWRFKTKGNDEPVVYHEDIKWHVSYVP